MLDGSDPRHLVIIGPCSADREDSVLDYATRLAALAERVRDKLVIVPRVYTNKPRTKGTGYKGLLHNPDPEGAPNLLEGVKAIRRMHLRVVEERACSPPTRCSTPPTTSTSSTFWPTSPWVPAPWRTRSTASSPRACRCPWA